MNKRLLNKSEELTDRMLDAVSREYGCRVFCKTRMIDVLSNRAGELPSGLLAFALQAHFDFTVTDSKTVPLFSVEFDGPSHLNAEQRARDAKKDRICDLFQHPLLRVRSASITKAFRGMTVLEFSIHAWFLQRSFEHAQSRGGISLDEPFDLASFVSTAGLDRDRRFPFWLSADAQAQLLSAYQLGHVASPVASSYVGAWPNGVRWGWSWVGVGDNRVIFAKTGAASASFIGHSAAELVYMISLIDLGEEVQRHMQGHLTQDLSLSDFMATHIVPARAKSRAVISVNCQ